MSAGLSTLPRLVKINLLTLLALVLTVSALLWPQWSSNPDLSHGLVMPLVFFFLLRESRSTGHRRYLSPGAPLYCLEILLIAIGLISLVFAGLYASAVDWSHALVALFLGLSLVSLLGAGLLVLSADSFRLIPFNWNAWIAIFLWLFCIPIPPGSYNRLTLTLQFFVTGEVLDTLHLLGIPATRMGNIIEMASTSVGVEEACSGIRSLISCVFAGFFFSATMLSRFWPRLVIILLSAPLAILMNFLRSLTLTLLANARIDIAGFWHDFTGFAVLGLTAGILCLIAWMLGRARQPAPAPAIAEAHTSPFSRRSQVTLLAGLLIGALTTGFFAFNSLKPAPHNKPVPDLAAVLPEHFNGWQVQTSNDLYQFADILHTRHLIQRSYAQNKDGVFRQITFYFAYWKPGQAPVSLVAMHTPDACWPGTGWVQVPLAEKNPALTVAGHLLPVAEARHFQSGDYPQYVWFWHLYAGRAITYIDPYSPRQLLQIAWRYGFQSKGDQLFVRVSSDQPWGRIEDEPLMREVFSKLGPYGL